jgi:hypothetical protein
MMSGTDPLASLFDAPRRSSLLCSISQAVATRRTLWQQSDAHAPLPASSELLRLCTRGELKEQRRVCARTARARTRTNNVAINQPLDAGVHAACARITRLRGGHRAR